jgi:hypothetical protein
MAEELCIGESEEIAPGVVIERRCVLRTLALALGSLALPGVAQAGESARLTFEQFLAEVIPVAKKLVADTSLQGQDRYLHTLASYAVRLVEVPIPEMKDSGQGVGPGTFIGFNPGGDPFTVLHWRMDPGSAIRTHAHSYGNVLTLGLDGEARVENFEMVGERDFKRKGTFKVRKTHEQLLVPGQVNLVNLEQSYVHGFRAGPKGARGLDFTTRLGEKQPTPYLDLGKKPLDPSVGIYEASWTV